MAIVFYVIGWIVLIVGAVLVGLAVPHMSGVAEAVNSATSFDATTLTTVVAPLVGGATIMFTGLLIMAIGGVLSRLDKIARNTRG